MASKRLIVTKESKTGRNLAFRDAQTGEDLSRALVVAKIKQGKLPGYHVRTVNGKETPVSNPDGSQGNNLG